MTSQVTEKKPLVLKDELAKLSRSASADTWLRDAHAEIENWRASMPGIDRLQLTSILEDGQSLEFRASDGWVKLKASPSTWLKREELNQKALDFIQRDLR